MVSGSVGISVAGFLCSSTVSRGWFLLLFRSSAFCGIVFSSSVVVFYSGQYNV